MNKLSEKKNLDPKRETVKPRWKLFNSVEKYIYTVFITTLSSELIVFKLIFFLMAKVLKIHHNFIHLITDIGSKYFIVKI